MFDFYVVLNDKTDLISTSLDIRTEGIFRKSGVPSRGAKLQAALCSGSTVSLDDSQANGSLSSISIHDVCCLLKKFIGELPRPLLLGDRLLELWLQVQPSLGESRRLEAVQLLLLFIPAPNRLFFSDLITLLGDVVAASSFNKMTASNLATVFTPILFLPKDVQASTLAAHSSTLTTALSFMISKGADIFKPPVSLLIKADTYLSKVKTAQQSEQTTKGRAMSSMMSTTALIPSTQFCATVDRPKDYTQQMVRKPLLFTL